jgi:hypothetical protein
LPAHVGLAQRMKHVTAVAERDKHVLEAFIRRFGPTSRAKIHELTHIRRSTMSPIVGELLKEGRVLEAGRLNSSMGRKQVLLRCNEEYRFLVGVEFDDETVRAGVMDLHPRIHHTVLEPARVTAGKRALAGQLVSCTHKALRDCGLCPDSLIGIGIADPGLVDSRNGVTVMSSTIEFWRDVPLELSSRRSSAFRFWSKRNPGPRPWRNES